MSGAGRFFDELLDKYKDDEGNVPPVRSWPELEKVMEVDMLRESVAESLRSAKVFWMLLLDVTKKFLYFVEYFILIERILAEFRKLVEANEASLQGFSVHYKYIHCHKNKISISFQVHQGNQWMSL